MMRFVCGALFWVAFLGLVAASHPASATLVLQHAHVIPMTEPTARAQAVAISGDRILAVGSDREILSLATEETVVLDLAGQTVLPGFVDPHTHFLSDSSRAGMSPQQALQWALSFGVTSAAELYATPEGLREAVAMADRSEIPLRMHLFLIYNTGCGDSIGAWYREYPPFQELGPHLRIAGVKIFAETSACGDELIGLSFGPELARYLSPAGREWYGDTRPLFSEAELERIVREADQLGFPVAIHALGDAGVETAIRAIEVVLDGRPNALRHTVLHNLFVPDELIASYSRSGIIAAVEPVNPCLVMFYNDLFPALETVPVRRWRAILDSGARLALDSDWPWSAAEAINPLFRLQAVTSPENTSVSYDKWEPCEPLPMAHLLTTWQGLCAMTIDAAYMLHRDDDLGTLVPGKLADLVVLTADPLTCAPEALTDIRVALTLVGGTVVYAAPSGAALSAGLLPGH